MSEPAVSTEGNVPRSPKGAKTRARLVKAAKTVFERDGFLNARISDIASQAGVSHGSFYHYFDSKEEIFREVAEAAESVLTSPPEQTAPPPSSPIERIRRANRRYLEQYRDEARIMGVVEEVSRYDEHVRAVRAETHKHFADRAERNIRQLQDDGRVDAAISPPIAAMALGAMVARFAELWLVQGSAEYQFDEAVDQLTRLWCNALGLEES
ncbi:MAG: TetR/AcrR family transcriptional regulator [Candidatus Binatia bacterium]|nr:TetR/AcrR family transcriptional regulator [Candidatus Binatia bacterium]